MNRYCNYSRVLYDDGSSVFQIQDCPSPVDQYPAQDFNVNEFGVLRNDISALARAQTLQEYELIASRLAEMRSDDEFKGLTDKELLLRIRPRFYSDLTELDKFANYLASRDVQLSKEQSEKVVVEETDSSEKIKFEPDKSVEV